MKSFIMFEDQVSQKISYGTKGKNGYSQGTNYGIIPKYYVSYWRKLYLLFKFSVI